MAVLEAVTHRLFCPSKFTLINFTQPLLSVTVINYVGRIKKKRTVIYFLLQIFKWFNSSGTPHNIRENLFWCTGKRNFTLFFILKIFGQIYVTWRFTPRTTSLQCLDMGTVRYKWQEMVWLILVSPKIVIASSSVMISWEFM